MYCLWPAQVDPELEEAAKQEKDDRAQVRMMEPSWYP